MILVIRTDKEIAEVGLFKGAKKSTYKKWEAHRHLAETLHNKIAEILYSQNKKLEELTGIVVFKGPGSFTGLRIGVSVANALAYSLQIPVMGAEGSGWLKQGLMELAEINEFKPVTVNYGADAKTTTPQK